MRGHMMDNRHDAKFGDIFRAKEPNGLTVMVIGTKIYNGTDFDFVTVTISSELERPEIDNWALYREQWDKIND
jgi:hypothetical protein